jgi:rhodanese-related sulfurtransferase
MTWMNSMFSNAPKAANTAPNSDAIIVDVRSPMEFATGHVAGAVSLPLNSFVDRYASVLPDKTQSMVVYCASGARSGQAVHYLSQQGYVNVINGMSVHNVARQFQKAIVQQ